jgi:dolichyl-phosphate-mannose-protein mannosyltransferase
VSIGRWELDSRARAGLAIGIVAAVAIRVILLPRPGLAGDVDDFLAWARAIGADGLGRAYDQTVSFPPVLPWLWWLLGSVAPGLLNPTANDPVALTLIKLPATVADFAIAVLVGLALRARPGWAIAGALAVLLVPAAWYVSAWWAQFESLYVLPMLAGWWLVTRGRPGWGAVAIAIALMTKPQALPLAVPFAAVYLRQFGWNGSLRAVGIAVGTAAVLWLPFLSAGGLGNYLRNLGDYSSLFAVVSLRAWNPWWILTDLAGGGRLIADGVSIAGPVTLRWIGFAIAGLFEAVVFLWVWRRPTATGLAWGLAAAALAVFVGLTEMHERYAFPVLVFLVLAWPDRLAVGTWLLLAATVSLNLVAAIPPSGAAGSLVPVGGPIGITGSLAMTVGLVACLWGLRRGAPGPEDDRPVSPLGATA